MKIKSTKFVISNTDINLCPAPVFPEYAFTGRSNVGKSSLINMITGTKNLAKTSVKPGKTQLINHFLINDNWYLVDLPGYGYAKISKEKRRNLNKFFKKYISQRKNLFCLFVLIDSRHKPQKNDIEFMEWLGNNQVPFVIAFTKSDKLSNYQLNKNLVVYKDEMLKKWEELPEIFVTSARLRTGREDVLDFIEQTNIALEEGIKE